MSTMTNKAQPGDLVRILSIPNITYHAGSNSFKEPRYLEHIGAIAQVVDVEYDVGIQVTFIDGADEFEHSWFLFDNKDYEVVFTT